jgi:hypothetical protein
MGWKTWTRTERTTVVVTLAAIALGVAATQLSVLRLGTEHYGSTVLVRRTGDLADLRMVDSAYDACTRRRASPVFLCAGSLAAKILHEDLALARWGVRGE